MAHDNITHSASAYWGSIYIYIVSSAFYEMFAKCFHILQPIECVLFFAKVQGREWHLAANWLTGPTRKANTAAAAALRLDHHPVIQSPRHWATQSSSHRITTQKSTERITFIHFDDSFD